MLFDGKLVVQVDPGTVIIDPESGRRFRVNEDLAVVQNNVLYVTPERFELLRRLAEDARAPVESAADEKAP
jgi:hypothetical protein